MATDVMKQYAAFHDAAFRGDVGLLTDLMKDENFKPAWINTALLESAREGKAKAVAFLLQHNPSRQACEKSQDAADENGYADVLAAFSKKRGEKQEDAHAQFLRKIGIYK